MDGGSTDGTVERLRQFQKSHPNLKLIQAPGTNIPKGRNIGISACSHELVASIDGGCRADPNWLENLRKSLTPEVDIVSGVYVPDSQSVFEGCVGDLMYPKLDELPNDWSKPSHRSVLMRKEVWRALGGFPPHLDLSEDTWFNFEAVRRGFKFKLARDAVVRWRPRRTLVDVFRSTYRWTRSDIKNSIYPNSSASLRELSKDFTIAILPFGWCLAAATAAAISFPIGITGLIVLSTLIARPFRVVRRFPEDRSLRKSVDKNLILYMTSVAWFLGYVTGSVARLLLRERSRTDDAPTTSR